MSPRTSVERLQEVEVAGGEERRVRQPRVLPPVAGSPATVVGVAGLARPRHREQRSVELDRVGPAAGAGGDEALQRVAAGDVPGGLRVPSPRAGRTTRWLRPRSRATTRGGPRAAARSRGPRPRRSSPAPPRATRPPSPGGGSGRRRRSDGVSRQGARAAGRRRGGRRASARRRRTCGAGSDPPGGPPAGPGAASSPRAPRTGRCGAASRCPREDRAGRVRRDGRRGVLLVSRDRSRLTSLTSIEGSTAGDVRHSSKEAAAATGDALSTATWTRGGSRRPRAARSSPPLRSLSPIPA